MTVVELVLTVLDVNSNLLDTEVANVMKKTVVSATHVVKGQSFLQQAHRFLLLRTCAAWIKLVDFQIIGISS